MPSVKDKGKTRKRKHQAGRTFALLFEYPVNRNARKLPAKTQLAYLSPPRKKEGRKPNALLSPRLISQERRRHNNVRENRRNRCVLNMSRSSCHVYPRCLDLKWQRVREKLLCKGKVQSTGSSAPNLLFLACLVLFIFVSSNCVQVSSIDYPATGHHEFTMVYLEGLKQPAPNKESAH